MAKHDTIDLVLEGGGAKGIGLVGAVARLLNDHKVARVAGTSAGAIVAGLVAAGYTGEALEHAMAQFPFQRVAHKRRIDHIPLVGPWISVATERGAFDTSVLRDTLAELLANRDVHTFGDLHRTDRGSSLPTNRRYSLVVTVTDLTSGVLLYLPWDYKEHFGLKPDDQPVADAIAASAAIPLYFEPVRLTNVLGEEHLLVDGGLLSNYPITVFDRTDNVRPRWPTFGVKIIPKLPVKNGELFPLLGRVPVPGIRQLEGTIATAIVGGDQTALLRPCVKMRTIPVDTKHVSLINFKKAGRSRIQDELFADSWNAADTFLDGWDETAYLNECRGIGVKAKVPAQV